VFGLDGTATTICYAATAGQLLDAAVERGAPVDDEPGDQIGAPAANAPEFPPVILQSG
jgi:hypothetical protein